MTTGIAELAGIAGLLRDDALARLARAVAARRAVEAELAAVDGGRAAGMSDPATARAAERHRCWIAARRRALLPRLAAARAEEETARIRAARAFGRAAVLAELSEGSR